MLKICNTDFQYCQTIIDAHQLSIRYHCPLADLLEQMWREYNQDIRASEVFSIFQLETQTYNSFLNCQNINFLHGKYMSLRFFSGNC